MSKRLDLKACGAMDAQDKSTLFTVCLHKTQIPSASKNYEFSLEHVSRGLLLWDN